MLIDVDDLTDTCPDDELLALSTMPYLPATSMMPPASWEAVQTVTTLATAYHSATGLPGLASAGGSIENPLLSGAAMTPIAATHTIEHIAPVSAMSSVIVDAQRASVAIDTPNIVCVSAATNRQFSTHVNELVAAEQVVDHIYQIHQGDEPIWGGTEAASDDWGADLWNTAALSAVHQTVVSSDRIAAAVHLADQTRARQRKRAQRAARRAARADNSHAIPDDEVDHDTGFATSVFYRRSIDDEDAAA